MGVRVVFIFVCVAGFFPKGTKSLLHSRDSESMNRSKSENVVTWSYVDANW